MLKMIDPLHGGRILLVAKMIELLHGEREVPSCAQADRSPPWRADPSWCPRLIDPLQRGGVNKACCRSGWSGKFKDESLFSICSLDMALGQL